MQEGFGCTAIVTDVLVAFTMHAGEAVLKQTVSNGFAPTAANDASRLVYLLRSAFTEP